MKISVTENKIKYAVAIALALIIATVLEITVFMHEEKVSFSGETVSVSKNEDIKIDVLGYNADEYKYTVISADPNIVISGINGETGSVLVKFLSPVYTQPRVQVFFKTADAEFTEENSFILDSLPFASRNALINIPAGSYDSIRVDIDSSFALDDIIISDKPIDIETQTKSFGILRFLVLFVGISALLVVFVFWYGSKKNERSLSKWEFLFCIACFGFYFIWAVLKPYDYAPDEEMRHQVTEFMFEHNRLPIGDELRSVWGFSYAHLPTVLCSELGYIFMKIASVFTSDAYNLLVSARMVSVLCATGSVYYIIKISKLLFNSCAKWLLIVFVAFMPQFAFLASYVNNDMVAFMGIAMIIYAWLLGTKYNWNYKNATLLSIGISVCGLSYYNSYIWILISVFIFCISYLSQNKKQYKNFSKLTGYIVALTFLLIGYSFIRHVVLYGDLLGFNTTSHYGELYALDWLKPSNRFSLFEQGVPVKTMLYDLPYRWLSVSWKSFVGLFGYMQYYCQQWVYDLVKWFIIIGGVSFVGKAVHSLLIKRQKPGLFSVLFYSSLVIGAAVTVALSFYNSYFIDFQPQGRYCYPAFLAIAIVVAKGYEWLLKFLKTSRRKYAVTSSVCTVFIMVSLVVFKNIYLPS